MRLCSPSHPMNIIVYTKRGCPWCEDMIDFLNNHAIAFEEREVLGNKEYFDEMEKKSGQSKAPTLDIDGEIFADTDAEAIEKLLRERGSLE